MNFETLQKDMVAAMKARDKARKETISSLVSALKKLAIDEGTRDNIPDELVDRAILKNWPKSGREQIKKKIENRFLGKIKCLYAKYPADSKTRVPKRHKYP